MEMTEATMGNLFVGIARVLEWEYGYRLLLAVTRHGASMLRDDRE